MALDTTTRGGSVALIRDDVVVLERVGNPEVSHVEQLPGAIGTLLAEAGLTPTALDVLAVASGPGGFTGLRVGLAATQGLALALDRPAVGVPILAATAWWRLARCTAAESAGVWLDAFRGEVFAAAYACAGPSHADWPLTELDPPTAVSPAAVVETWQSLLPRGAYIIGAVGPVFAAAAAAGGFASLAAPPALAGAVGLVGRQIHLSGGSGPPHALAPLYVRRPDAVVERERRVRGVASPP